MEGGLVLGIEMDPRERFSCILDLEIVPRFRRLFPEFLGLLEAVHLLEYGNPLQKSTHELGPRGKWEEGYALGMTEDLNLAST